MSIAHVVLEGTKQNTSLYLRPEAIDRAKNTHIKNLSGDNVLVYNILDFDDFITNNVKQEFIVDTINQLRVSLQGGNSFVQHAELIAAYYQYERNSEKYTEIESSLLLPKLQYFEAAKLSGIEKTKAIINSNLGTAEAKAKLKVLQNGALDLHSRIIVANNLRDGAIEYIKKLEEDTTGAKFCFNSLGYKAAIEEIVRIALNNTARPRNMSVYANHVKKEDGTVLVDMYGRDIKVEEVEGHTNNGQIDNLNNLSFLPQHKKIKTELWLNRPDVAKSFNGKESIFVVAGNSLSDTWMGTKDTKNKQIGIVLAESSDFETGQKYANGLIGKEAISQLFVQNPMLDVLVVDDNSSENKSSSFYGANQLYDYLKGKINSLSKELNN